MNLMLTDPDVLADYVNDFYGPNGPYPTPTERELAEMEAAGQLKSSLLKRFIKSRKSTLFLRTSNALSRICLLVTSSSQGAQNFWAGFGQLMDNNPEDAWKVLSQADPRAFQQKLLVQDL